MLHVDSIECDTQERDIYSVTILRAEQHNTLSHREVTEGLMCVCLNKCVFEREREKTERKRNESDWKGGIEKIFSFCNCLLA